MSWFEKLIPSRIGARSDKRGNVPEGLWVKCDSCSSVLYRAELERALDVCSKCGHHMQMNARARLRHLLDAEEQQELASGVEPVDILKFKDSKRYRDRLAQATKDSGEKDALVVMSGRIYELPVVVAVFDFRFMGGSMGSVVGEKFARACEYCLRHHVPLVCFSASGGARMQEALFSLLQMGKTSAQLAQMSRQRVPFISVLTDPTMGGVSASLAMLGDIIIAEPGARIGFAGRRVIEQTVREQLPEGFQSSEFLLEHGAIDMIVSRHQMRRKLGYLLRLLTRAELPMPIEDELPPEDDAAPAPDAAALQASATADGAAAAITKADAEATLASPDAEPAGRDPAANVDANIASSEAQREADSSNPVIPNEPGAADHASVPATDPSAGGSASDSQQAGMSGSSDDAGNSASGTAAAAPADDQDNPPSDPASPPR